MPRHRLRGLLRCAAGAILLAVATPLPAQQPVSADTVAGRPTPLLDLFDLLKQLLGIDVPSRRWTTTGDQSESM